MWLAQQTPVLFHNTRSATERYGVCGFVAYLDGRPAGLVEFLPVDAVPYPEERPVDTVFILCLYVRRDSQKKGVGGEIMRHLFHYLRSEDMPQFDQRKAAAIEVYVPRGHPDWPDHIQFPTGSKDFYERFGFSLEKMIPNQKGYLYRLEL